MYIDEQVELEPEHTQLAKTHYQLPDASLSIIPKQPARTKGQGTVQYENTLRILPLSFQSTRRRLTSMHSCPWPQRPWSPRDLLAVPLLLWRLR